jgi:hypothetical protein
MNKKKKKRFECSNCNPLLFQFPLENMQSVSSKETELASALEKIDGSITNGTFTQSLIDDLTSILLEIANDKGIDDKTFEEKLELFPLEFDTENFNDDEVEPSPEKLEKKKKSIMKKIRKLAMSLEINLAGLSSCFKFNLSYEGENEDE